MAEPEKVVAPDHKPHPDYPHYRVEPGKSIDLSQVDPNQFPNQQVFEITLTKRLVVIGTVAANAPYIGLLGTVLGIMLTFHTMGTAGTIAVSTIMIGLSLALKATAAGLLVAIPCVVMNNVLRRRVTELMTLYRVQHGS